MITPAVAVVAAVDWPLKLIFVSVWSFDTADKLFKLELLLLSFEHMLFDWIRCLFEGELLFKEKPEELTDEVDEEDNGEVEGCEQIEEDDEGGGDELQFKFVDIMFE